MRGLAELLVRRLGEQIGEVCAIRFVTEDRQWLHETGGVIYHRDPEIADLFQRLFLAVPQRLGEGLAGRVAATGEPLRVSGLTTAQIASQVAPQAQELVKRLGLSSLLAVPLRVRNKIIGVVSLGRGGSNPYTPDDQQLVQDLADRAALAIKNATLFASLEQRVGELQKAEEKFRGLLESAPDALIIAGKDGRILLGNARTEALFGYAREELLGQHVELLIPRYPHADGASNEATSRLNSVLELEGRTKGGPEFPAEISLGPIDTIDGPVIAVAVRDITERRRLEEFRRKSFELEEQSRRAQEASKLKSEFLANMSHELRTPLNAILGFSQLLLEHVVRPESGQHDEFLGDIIKSGKHLLQLINDILDLAKVESGKLDLRPEPIDLEMLVREVTDVIRGIAAAKRIQTDVAIDAALAGGVFLDPARLKQVLYNYLSNALKFTPEQGKVSVRLLPERETSFRIEGQDSGPGIPPKDLSRLFVEFH